MKPDNTVMPGAADAMRLRVVIRGAVQGVGFRPFVYRLATEASLRGWVSNTSQGVFIEVEGPKTVLDTFLLRVGREKPPRSSIQSLESSFLDPVGFESFEIRESEESGPKTVLVMADIATCPDCLKEVFDISNRRYQYPFTNCTNCGPRFTIIEALPYDRSNTSMKKFPMCPACNHEYQDPDNRRFHAQPNACPVCGPHVELWDAKGKAIALHRQAIIGAVKAIRAGSIVAVKGLGGFHLVVDARNEQSVLELRKRKNREEKPLALMVPTIQAAKDLCSVSELEERLLASPEAPIVLLEKKPDVQGSRFEVQSSAAVTSNLEHRTLNFVSPSVAPNNPYLGIMLPYTPLHHILMHELGFPVIATSGNLSDEPICTDEQEALKRLNGIADVFLIHNRPIVRHVDDSIARVMLGRELVLRRARGYAPLPVPIPAESHPVLAVGAHLKNTIALQSGNNTFISQHIGDLETEQSFDAFHAVIADFQKLYEVTPSEIVCDMHPDYLSTKFARSSGIPTFDVQHHYAHVASCMAENELTGTILGVSWDGTGYGTDETIWGGEFLLTKHNAFERVATFKHFRLPGGEQAIKEPRRTAIGLLHELYGESVYTYTFLLPVSSMPKPSLTVIQQMLAKGVNSPLTSSVGRLFDAVASITGLRHAVHFEGQAAMELEFVLAGVKSDESYSFLISEDNPMIVDWAPMMFEIIADLEGKVPVKLISAKFHNTLAEIIVSVAGRIREPRVVLSGGCFQNRYLTERTVRLLESGGFKPYWHQRVPPNDGGIALGQIYARQRSGSSAAIPESLTEATP